MVFADIGSYPTSHANIRYCADGLRELGTLGIEPALTRLAHASDGKRRLKRARLLARAAKYRMPESSTFWKTAEPEAIAATIDAWRADLVERGLLDVSLQPLVDSTTSNGFACDDAPGLIDAPE